MVTHIVAPPCVKFLIGISAAAQQAHLVDNWWKTCDTSPS